MRWLKSKNIGERVALADIPVVPYAVFYEEMERMLAGEDFHCANYFGVKGGAGVKFYCLLLDDATGDVLITSWEYDYYGEEEIRSLTPVHNSLHVFEREITEEFGVAFRGSLYDKPLRFPRDRADRSKTINNYPFYNIEGHSLHEVNVGPIHAGIIEPGVFRFICNGEKVLHLEIVLGFQHRGVEKLMAGSASMLRQAVMSESVAGDSAVSHATAWCGVMEGFARRDRLPELDRQRAVAAELERIAMHIADTGALCTDIGYQLGQVACEALRTIVINTTQLWCGNRFGKSLVRPFGTDHPLTAELSSTISRNITEVRRRYDEVCEDMFAAPSVLSRFEDCGVVSRSRMIEAGAVGMAARASGLRRDIRSSHPYGAYLDMAHEPAAAENGDVMARILIRYREVLQSVDHILWLLSDLSFAALPAPDYDLSLPADSISFALVEGWRGEICHAAVTDGDGRVARYKIKDPSLHNWYALSLAVRGEGVSDFPICNKSFNLSYCGHDL